ncbi:CAP domain-containing protein [Roseateles sp. BYS87W]|uniref:CAP domain-containing protein n=1 Tax=Pelomonas baiyunensis TaxID=3299026 RepID=A0ABW7H1J0_9BURK
MRKVMLGMLAWWGVVAVQAQPACSIDLLPALDKINALRAQGAMCGNRRMANAGPVRAHPALDASARSFAQDLATQDRLSHLNTAGQALRARLRESGYAMRTAAENVAGGAETLDEVLEQWMASPLHCENLMAPEFQEFGLACATGSGALERFWVLQLAQPARAP